MQRDVSQRCGVGYGGCGGCGAYYGVCVCGETALRAVER